MAVSQQRVYTQRPGAPQRPGGPNLGYQPVNPGNTSLADLEAKQEADIQKSYSKMRTGLALQGDVARKQTEEDLARQQGLQGGFGGATLKLREKAFRNLADTMAAQEAGVGAQEAQQLAALGSEKSGRQFATQERIGGEAFAASQNELARRQQQEQFLSTLKEQGRQFDAEFNENRLTNAVNAAVAFKDAKLRSPADWQVMWQGVWGNLYGNRIPGSVQSSNTANATPGVGGFGYTLPNK